MLRQGPGLDGISANQSLGPPYMAVLLGAGLVLPGPHLHAGDLLGLKQAEPPRCRWACRRSG
jgi:hypothetical protein